MVEKQIIVEQERPQGWLRRLIGLRQRYPERTIRAWLAEYDGEEDFDTPALIVTEEDAREAGLLVGTAVILEEDVDKTGTPPAGRVCLLRWRSAAMPGSIVVLCQWWARRERWDGTREQLWRRERPLLLPVNRI